MLHRALRLSPCLWYARRVATALSVSPHTVRPPLLEWRFAAWERLYGPLSLQGEVTRFSAR